MLVNEILRRKSPGVMTVDPDESVWVALRSLRMHQIGALVVTDEADRLIGLFTERDVVNGLVAEGKQLLNQEVQQVMSTGVPTCTPTDSVAMVMATMTDRRTRHLPVIEDSGVRGIVSIGDIVKARLDDLELENRVLRGMTRART